MKNKIDHEAALKAGECMARIKSYALGLSDAGKSDHLLNICADYSRAMSHYQVSLNKVIAELREKYPDMEIDGL